MAASTTKVGTIPAERDDDSQRHRRERLALHASTRSFSRNRFAQITAVFTDRIDISHLSRYQVWLDNRVPCRSVRRARSKNTGQVAVSGDFR
jgi:hypothetical protein